MCKETAPVLLCKETAPVLLCKEIKISSHCTYCAHCRRARMQRSGGSAWRVPRQEKQRQRPQARYMCRCMRATADACALFMPACVSARLLCCFEIQGLVDPSLSMMVYVVM
jgi:hypothetical protein